MRISANKADRKLFIARFRGKRQALRSSSIALIRVHPG
jgi:hypothetical protein